MSKSKVKKVKLKTHKSSKKRFSLTAGGKLMHRGQGDNGHSKNYESRRQKRNPRKERSLTASGEIKKIKKLIGA
jgi:ribosomal protein L35